MTARYNSSDNTLKEISQMERPVRPNQRDYDQVSLGGLIYDADLKKYFLDSDKYNAHIASLRTLYCSPECVGEFIHDCDYEAGKDYEIKTAGEWKWCTQLNGNVFAALVVPVKSEEKEMWMDAITLAMNALADDPFTPGKWLEVVKSKYTITRKQ